MQLFMFSWDPTVSTGTIINGVLFLIMLIAFFFQRSKDLETLKSTQKLHNEMINKLSESQIHLTNTLSKVSERQTRTETIVEMLAKREQNRD